MRGFTLIELLVVIGIIAVLAAMLLPVLAKAKERALKIACMSNLHQIGIGLTLYAGDNRDKVPSEAAGGTAWPWDMPWDAGNLMLTAVGGTPKIFFCPSTAPRFTDWQNWQEPGVVAGIGQNLWNFNPNVTHITGYTFAFSGKGSLLYWTNQNQSINIEHVITIVTAVTTLANGPMISPADRVISADSVLSEGNATPGYKKPANNYVSITGGFTQNGAKYPHLSNHVDPKTQVPEGLNLLYKDGHSTWENFNQAIVRGAYASTGSPGSGAGPYFWW